MGVEGTCKIKLRNSEPIKLLASSLFTIRDILKQDSITTEDLISALEKYEEYRANQPKYEIDVEANIKKILVYDMTGKKNEIVEEIEFTSMEDFKEVRDKYDAKFRFIINKNKLKKL